MPTKTSKDHEKAIKTVAKSGGIVLIGIIISRLLGYFTRITIARFLGPEGMGLVYLTTSFVGIVVTLSVFGLPSAIQRYVSYYKGKKELGKVKGVIIGSLKISIPLSLLSASVLFFFSDFFAITIFQKPEMSILIKILSISIPFNILLKISDSSIRGFHIVKYFTYINKIFSPLVKFLPIIPLILLGFGAKAGVIGYSFGFVSTGIVLFYLLETRVFSVIKIKVKSVNLTRKIAKFSWPLMIAGILWTFVGQIDTVMIGSMIKDSVPLGIYQSALPTSKFINIIPIALTSLFLPIISNLLSKKKDNEIRDVYRTTSKWIFYVNLPLLFLFLVFPDAILNALFGEEFIGGGIVLSILALGFFVNTWGNIGKKIINMKEKTKITLLNSLVTVLVDIILNYFLIPIYGIVGSAIATMISFFVYTILNLVFTYRILHTHPFDAYFLKSLLSALVAGSFFYYITNILLKKLTIPTMAISTIFFFAFYSLLLLFLKGLDKNDVIILKSLERKTGIKIKWLRDIIKKFI